MGLGDEIIVTGQARVLQQTDPRKVRVQYERQKWFAVWDHNPRIARPDEQGDFQVLEPRDARRLRPYCSDKTHRRWTWREFRPPRGELYFTPAERDFGRRHAGRVILEPHIKAGASPNKQWGWVRWNRLAWLLQEKHGVRVTQLGALGVPQLEGAEYVPTRSIREAAAVLAHARVAVLPEGGLHHTAAAVNARAVVIYGGFIAPAVTGYDDQVSLFSGEGLGCGMRVPCGHCANAMQNIKPEAVADRVMEVMGEASTRLVPA